MQRILIVRMSALGDIVHALPVLAEIRAAYPAAEVDWLVDARYAGILSYADGLTQKIIGRPGLVRAVARLRERSYDVAVDLQGLLKSAAMARLSGAKRVIGFEAEALREPGARWFHTETAPVPAGGHVIQKNLAILSLLDVTARPAITFPLTVPPSKVADDVAGTADAAGGRFALINPGAAWPNKRWAPERFGAVARHLRDQHGLPAWVLWGRDEGPLADAVVAASSGAAVRAPETSLGDLLALSARASLFVSGDTGPLHLAAAMATPIVALFGPTWPARNGPWREEDVIVSRADVCVCHHKRQCQRPDAAADAARMCINEITVDEVTGAVDRRLARAEAGQ